MARQAAHPVPEPTVRRLPLYLRYLKDLQGTGRTSVSCTDIGAQLKLDPTQVRKDLQVAGVAGRPRVGYGLPQLVAAIEQFLGLDHLNQAFLVGAGSMGAALLGYRRFEEYGLNIVAAFDADEVKIGTRIHGKSVLPLKKLTDLARRMHILIGIITVPADAAQPVADLMVQGGIRAIWNFAPMRLRVPEGTIVHNEDLYCSLAALSQKLTQALRESSGPAVPGSGQPSQSASPLPRL
jgi:redox-sensing transcriptional repressor